MISRSPKITWLVFALAAIGAFSFQGSRGLRESTEGRYAECARETLHSNDLSEPMLNGSNHWTKPPLTYWAIIAGFKVFGENTWGARAYLAVSFILTVLAVHVLGSELWGREDGVYCALVYATSPFTLVAANVVSTDTILALWEALALMFFWLAIRRGSRRYMTCMFAALGLAVFTKGPVGLLPLLGILPAYVILRRGPVKPPAMMSISGAASFVFFGLSWYLVEIIRHPELFRYWLIDETIGRAGAGTTGHNPQFYKVFKLYVPYLLLGTGPWIFLLLLKAKYIPWPGERWLYPMRWAHGLAWTFLLFASLPALALFFLAKSKLILYILPLFVPMSLALGKGLSHILKNGNLRLRTVAIVALVVVVLIVGLKRTVANVPDKHNMEQLAVAMEPILLQFPEHQLYILRNRTLNGLEFYLREMIYPITHDQAIELTGATSNDSTANLILVEKGDANGPEGLLEPSVNELVPLTSYWALEVPADSRSESRRFK